MSGEVGWICHRWAPYTWDFRWEGWVSIHPPPPEQRMQQDMLGKRVVRIHLVLNDAKMVQSNVF